MRSSQATTARSNADLVVVGGDPLKDMAVLQDRSRRSVMTGGRFVTRNLS